MAKVVIDVEDSEGIEIALDKRMSFGSSSGNDVQIDAEGVDAFHAVLFKDESGTYWVKHISMVGITLVNGHTANFTKLRDQDCVEMGSLKGTFYEHEDLVPAEKPLPDPLEVEAHEALAKLNDAKAQLEKELESLEKTLQVRQEEVQVLDLRRKDLSADVEKDLKRAQEIESQTRAVREVLTRLQSQEKECLDKQETLQFQQAEATKTLELQESKLKTLNLAVVEREATLRSLSQEEETRLAKLQALSASLAETETKHHALEASLLLQVKQMEGVTAQLQLHQNLELQINQSETRKRTLEESIRQLEATKQAEKVSLKELAESVARLQAQKTALDPEVQQLESRREQLKVTLAQLIQQQEQSQTLTDEIEVATRQLSNLGEQVRLTESRLNEGCEWLIGQERVAREMQEVLETLHANRERVDAECEALRVKLDTWQRRVEHLELKQGRLLGGLEQMQARTLHLSEIQTFLSQGEALWRQKEDQMERQFVQDQQVLAELRLAIDAAQKELGGPQLEKPQAR